MTDSQDDGDYYLEMEKNREYLTRSKVAELYKDSARRFMMEALYLFLEQKQTDEIEGLLVRTNGVYARLTRLACLATQIESREIHEYMLHVIQNDSFGCLSKLWDQAIEWARKEEDVAQQSDIFGNDMNWRPTNFNLWWLRAANARGHAEWLLRERSESLLVGHSDPIEPWRLLPPGNVEHYDNSCVIWSLQYLMAHCKGHRIDAFGTEFNIASEEARGLQSRNFGWPYYSFVYGAPVSHQVIAALHHVVSAANYLQEFVYHALAEDSTRSSLIGFLPTDDVGSSPGQFMTSLSVYDRYMRRGMSSTLDQSCPDHYRTLARCADDILAEWDAEAMLEHLISPRYRESNILSLLLTALQSILDKRMHMTLQEANEMNFERVSFACITFFMDKIQRLLHRPPGLSEHRYMILVERKVAALLSPWFDFRMHQTRGGRMVVELKSLLSRQTMVDPSMSEYMSIANPIWACYEIAVISALDGFLDTIRELLVGNVVLPHQTYLFILPFKDYLESGDPTKMPLIQGSAGNRRELTKLGMYRSGRIKCKPACKCPLPKRIQEMEENLLYQVSDHPKAKAQRKAIAAFYSLNEGLAHALNTKFVAITLERQKLLSRVQKLKNGTV